MSGQSGKSVPSSFSRKPSRRLCTVSVFKQQRLPALQPILTARALFPTFFIIGLLLIPIGITLLHVSSNVKEFVYNYTDCISQEDTSLSCADILEMNIFKACTCVIPISLADMFEGDVYIYYGLSNFYQNHRRYVKSRDDHQLLGALGPVSNECEPFARYLDTKNPCITKEVVPCGAIADSMFNDTLTLTREDGNLVPVLNTGIAWPSDKQMKFRNPPNSHLNLIEVYKDYVKPRSWRKNIWELDPTNPDNNGLQNEDLIVWMDTDAFSTFRKFYRRLNCTAEGYNSGLKAGNYTLKVDYNYPVKSFTGSKRIIISTTSLLGGKNPFLGIAYIVLGCITLLLGIVFLIKHLKYRKRTSEMINVTPRSP